MADNDIKLVPKSLSEFDTSTQIEGAYVAGVDKAGKSVKVPITTLKGNKGDQGDTPIIGDNGNWWIGGVDTGSPSIGGEEYALNGGSKRNLLQVDSLKQTNGLDFGFPTRENREIDAMSIIQEIYFSVLDENIDISTGISISVLSIREYNQGGYEFILQLVPSDVSGDGQAVIHLSKIYDVIPTNVEEFYFATDKYKLHVRIDFLKLGLRDVVYNWQTPICNVTNIIDADSQFWDRVSYIAKDVASKQEVDAINSTLNSIKGEVPAFDFNTPLDQGFYEVYNNKVRVSSLVPDQYYHLKIPVPLDGKIKVTLNPYGAVVYGVIYTDANDNVTGKELKGNDKNELYEGFLLSPPLNSAFACLSGYAKSPLEAYINGLDAVSRKEFEEHVNKTGCEEKILHVSGDSITAEKYSWVSVVQQELKFANVINSAVGSACWSKRRVPYDGNTYETQDYKDLSFAGISDRWEAPRNAIEAQQMANNCAIVHIQKFIKEVQEKKHPIPDISILAYGTNSDTSIGDAQTALQGKGLDNVDLFTMAGAMRWCMQTLLTEYPKLKIFISLPIQSANPNLNATNLQKIAVMKEVCVGMSVPYFDCYAESGIVEKFEVLNGAGRHLYDGIHENDDGKQVHGNYASMMMKRYI